VSDAGKEIDVERVARIARLMLTEKEKQKFERDLREVIKAFAVIDRVKTDVEPSFQPLRLENVLREDKVGESLPREEALKNTMHKEKGFFKGPKVV